MNQYIVISCTDIEDFVKFMDDYLQSGWKLAGGMSVLRNDLNIIQFYQAVYKPRRVFKIGKEDKKMCPEDQTGI